MSRDRQKTRACRRPRGIHNQSIDQAGPVYRHRLAWHWYFRISLLVDVYYLFDASNPFDISRRRISKSADHRQLSREDANINNFLCRVPADIVRRYYPYEQAALIR